AGDNFVPQVRKTDVVANRPGLHGVVRKPEQLIHCPLLDEPLDGVAPFPLSSLFLDPPIVPGHIQQFGVPVEEPSGAADWVHWLQSVINRFESGRLLLAEVPSEPFNRPNEVQMMSNRSTQTISL